MVFLLAAAGLFVLCSFLSGCRATGAGAGNESPHNNRIAIQPVRQIERFPEGAAPVQQDDGRIEALQNSITGIGANFSKELVSLRADMRSEIKATLNATLEANIRAQADLRAQVDAKFMANLKASADLRAEFDAKVQAQAGAFNRLEERTQTIAAGRDASTVTNEYGEEARSTVIWAMGISAGVIVAFSMLVAFVMVRSKEGSRARAEEREKRLYALAVENAGLEHVSKVGFKEHAK